MFFRKQFGDFHGKKLVSLEENLPSEKNQTKQHSHILQVYDPDLDLLSKFGARYALKPGGQIKLGWHSDATRAWSMTKKTKIRLEPAFQSFTASSHSSPERQGAAPCV
jgi:hypothetical protein